MNDTASVVASGYAFSEAAGDFATMVKLTRTIAIIPTVLVFAYIGTRIKRKELQSAGEDKKVNVMKIIPWLIAGFLALAILNSVGWIPGEVSGLMKTANKFLMVTALAAIGLGTSLTDFKKPAWHRCFMERVLPLSKSTVPSAERNTFFLTTAAMDTMALQVCRRKMS